MTGSIFCSARMASSPRPARSAWAARSEPYNPLWYEEPIPPDNLLEFAEVAKSRPRAPGDGRADDHQGRVRHPPSRRAASRSCSPRWAASAASGKPRRSPPWPRCSTPRWPRIFTQGPIEWAANVHFAASIPNLLIAETIETGGAFHLKLIRNSIKWEDGYIIPPDAPGLGIDFDEDLARAHPFTGTGLHLQMQEAPCDYRHGNRFEGGAPSAKT